MNSRYSFLLNQEKRTTIWFLWLFYFVYFSYELIYYFVLPNMPWKIAPINNKSIIDFIIYIVLVCLIPIAYQLIKENNPAPVKYIYFLVFTTTNIVVDILLT